MLSFFGKGGRTGLCSFLHCLFPVACSRTNQHTVRICIILFVSLFRFKKSAFILLFLLRFFALDGENALFDSIYQQKPRSSFRSFFYSIFFINNNKNFSFVMYIRNKHKGRKGKKQKRKGLVSFCFSFVLPLPGITIL